MGVCGVTAVRIFVDQMADPVRASALQRLTIDAG
jgi:hypothetical protein